MSKKEIIVEIVDSGYTYRTYKEWIEHNFPEYLPLYREREQPLNGTKCKYIGHTRHSNGFSISLSLLQDIKTNQVYILSSSGFRIIDVKTVNLGLDLE